VEARSRGVGEGSEFIVRLPHAADERRVAHAFNGRRQGMSDPHGSVQSMQSEQRRQRQRERKRLNREEKRRTAVAPLDVSIAVVPRMSDVLIDFAWPIVRALGDNPRREELEAVLTIAATVWNAMVEEGDEVDDALVDISEDLQGCVHPPPLEVLAMLATRKALWFRDDTRTVTSVEVSRRGGELRITARSALLE
jgi:hypothetical protein